MEHFITIILNFQITVMATDGGTPARQGYVTVYFDVSRNHYAPTVTSPNQNVTILESDSARIIAQVNGSDADLQVSLCS